MCLKIVYPIFPMVLLIIIPIKWLFVWEYTLFSDKPIWTCWMPQKIGATWFRKVVWSLESLESWNILKLVESLEAQEVGWEKHLESMWAWRLPRWRFFCGHGNPMGIRWDPMTKTPGHLGSLHTSMECANIERTNNMYQYVSICAYLSTPKLPYKSFLNPLLLVPKPCRTCPATAGDSCESKDATPPSPGLGQRTNRWHRRISDPDLHCFENDQGRATLW